MKKGRPKGRKTRLDPVSQCGWIKKDGKPCRNKKGMGTKHLGVGQCWKHPGGKSADANLKHGRNAKLLQNSMSFLADVDKRMERDDHEFIDLRRKLSILEELIERFVQRYDKDSQTLALWSEVVSPEFDILISSDDPAELAAAVQVLKSRAAKRPEEVKLEVGPLVTLIEAASRNAERFQRMRLIDAIPRKVFEDWLLPQMLTAVSQICDDKQVERLARVWSKIRW